MPNEYTTSNRHWFNDNIMSIRWRENIYEFPHHFNVLLYFFNARCNFDEQKIDVVLMYFVRQNFNERKIDFVSMSFQCTSFDLILMDKNIDIVSMYFFKQFWWKTDVNSKCWFWFVFEREKIVVVLTSLFQKFLIYQKLKPFELYFWT